MLDINQLIRANIKNLKPYTSARDEYKGDEGIFLDANESAYGELNRYPDPYQSKLKRQLAEIKNISAENIFIGNGSDEIIDLVIRLFCEPSSDKIVCFSPTYGMYEVLAELNNVEVLNIRLNDDFQIELNDLNNIIENDTEGKIKLMFICSPNNPTGNNINDIDIIVESFKGIVIIDEAYIDYSSKESFISNLNKYKNVIVIQTMSKAWGLAAARLGIAYASTEIIQYMNRIKAPYNISDLNQKAAELRLMNMNNIQTQITITKEQREWLKTELSKISIVDKIYPSDTNFLLVQFTDADIVYQELIKQKVIVRNRNSVIKNCIRITVGKQEENIELINALKKIK